MSRAPAPAPAKPARKPSTSAPSQRVIKKYPNRRLYDTDTSTYITLAQVREQIDRLDRDIANLARLVDSGELTSLIPAG